MLLPIVPTMITKVHDDEDYSDSNYYKYICKQLQKLQERKKQQQQQQQKRFYQQFHLWFTPNKSTYEDNHNNNRNDHCNNVLQHQQRGTIITLKERRIAAENQLQRHVQSKPEPKFEPEPEPEPQLNPQPEEEPTSGEVLEEYDSKPASLFEFAKLENLQLENLNGKPELKFELDELDLLQLHKNLKPLDSPIWKPEYSVYEDHCSQKNERFNLKDSDSKGISLPLSEKTIDFENQQFKAFCMARKIRLLKRNVFTNRRSPYVILKPLQRRYHDFEEVYGGTVRKILEKIKMPKHNPQCNSSISSKSSEGDSPVLTKSSEADNPVPSKSSETNSSLSLIFSEADNCLHYMSDGEEGYIERCKNIAARGNKAADKEYLKWLRSWKDFDSFETDSEDEATASRIAVEEQVSFRHVFNVSQLVMAHVSVPKPSLLKPLSTVSLPEASLSPEASSSEVSPSSSEASPLSSEASPSSLEASVSLLETLPSLIKNPLNNENINQRITRSKAEEIQQQMAYKIKKSTLIDHCYHQTNVPETEVKEELETEESEDDEGEIIDVVSVKTGKKQKSFAKRTRCDLKRKEENEDSDEDQLSEPPVSRRRGRPPGSTKRKANRSGPAPKRARIQNNVQSNCQQPEQPEQPSCQHQNSIRQCASQRDSSDDTERRRLHNDMERQRRIYMKESYEELRMHVPAITYNNKASKVSILKQGATYIKSLTEIRKTLIANFTHLQHQNKMLKRKLQQRLNAVGIRSSFS